MLRQSSCNRMGKSSWRSTFTTLVSLRSALMRFTSTGQLDTTFGSGGIATFPVPPGDTGSVVYDIIVDGDDNIITSGISIGSNGTELMLTCFTPGGALDTTFGESSGTPGVNTGYVTESFGYHATGTRLGRQTATS